MERGPMALFGAIVAVGLGPAMWLGAQFGGAIDRPDSPPAVTSERGPQQATQDKGGEAGSAPDNSVIVETTPRSEIQPLPNSPKRPKPHKTTKPASSASPSPSSSSAAPGGGNGDDHSAPPSGGDQSAPPGGGTGPGDNQPPSPPAGQTGGGTGSGGGGSGGTGDGQPIAS